VKGPEAQHIELNSNEAVSVGPSPTTVQLPELWQRIPKYTLSLREGHSQGLPLYSLPFLSSKWILAP
jgi:hypothetical protein